MELILDLNNKGINRKQKKKKIRISLNRIKKIIKR